MLVTPQRLPNPALVGKSATYIAEKAGIRVPAGTRVLIAPLTGVGRDYPLSIEKLCPVLSFYVVKDWREGCERCKQILRYGGMGHTMSIHSRNDEVILEFGLKKPAFRIVVNTPTTHGSIGLTTGLDPAMTLGCGGYGGNITSDNISPRHLLNIKRLAYETSPAVVRRPSVGRASRPLPTPVAAAAGARSARSRRGLSAESLARRIDEFLQREVTQPRTIACGGHCRSARLAARRRRRLQPAAVRRRGRAAAARVRLRGGRAAGDQGGTENRPGRASDRDAGGARSGGEHRVFVQARLAR